MTAGADRLFGRRTLQRPPRPKHGASGGAWSVKPAHVEETIDVRALRLREGITQQAFAKRYGFAWQTVRDWEQGRRTPDRIARAMLTLIARDPKTVRRMLRC